MTDQLVLERNDGWPRGLAHIFLVGAFVLFFWGLSLPTDKLQHQVIGYAGVCVASTLVLRTYRRGTILDRRIRTMRRWWGVALSFLPARPLRYTGERSLQGYKEVSVHRTTALDTWKTWRTDMFHVQLQRPDDKLGPASPFRVRLIVDDEFTSRAAANATATRVADFLGLPLLDLEAGPTLSQ